VAVLIVDGLEVVDVDERDAERAVAIDRGLDLLGQARLYAPVSGSVTATRCRRTFSMSSAIVVEMKRMSSRSSGWNALT
jgi:hypothetical protein